MEERKKIIITKGREFELSYQRQNVDCCQKVFASEKTYFLFTRYFAKVFPNFLKLMTPNIAHSL
jgi:hypothetical protein